MKLQLDPNTPKGQVQIEAIKWAESQMNKIMQQYFDKGYKVQRGLTIEFLLDQHLRKQQDIRVNVHFLEPRTIEEFDEAVQQAKDTLFDEVISTRGDLDDGSNEK